MVNYAHKVPLMVNLVANDKNLQLEFDGLADLSKKRNRTLDFEATR